MSAPEGKRNAMRVAICVPSADDWKADFGFDLAGLMYCTATYSEGLELILLNHRTSNLPNGRNQLVVDALRLGADYIFWLDADMRFPTDTLIRLLLRKKEVVGANCVLRAYPTRATAWKDGKFLYTEAGATGLEEVDMVGTAIMLVHTSVFQVIEPPAFFFVPRDDNPMECLGEDQYFCKKLKAAGYQIFIDHGLSNACGHVGNHAFTMEMARQCRDKTPVLLNDLSINKLRLETEKNGDHNLQHAANGG